MKRILIADDHEAVRSGLRAVLEGRAGWEVVAEARDGKEAVAGAFDKRPDVAIIDHEMPIMTGIEVARRIREQQQTTEILIFTMHKPFYAGSFSNELRSMFSSEVKGVTTGRADANQLLSPRERTIVRLVAEGHSNKGVSAILNLSIKTTETHRAAAMRKLNINSTAGLVRYAVRSKLVEA